MLNNDERLDSIIEEALDEVVPLATIVPITPVTISNAQLFTERSSIVIDCLSFYDVFFQDLGVALDLASKLSDIHLMDEYQLQQLEDGIIAVSEGLNEILIRIPADFLSEVSDRVNDFCSQINAHLRAASKKRDDYYLSLHRSVDMLAMRHSQIVNDIGFFSSSDNEVTSPLPRGRGLLCGGDGFFDSQHEAQYREELAAASDSINEALAAMYI